MAKTASNSTLGAGSDFTAQGPARGFRSGDRDDSGMKMGGAERAGLFGGGNFLGGLFGPPSPGRMVGAGIGTMVGGPIGGLLGGMLGSRAGGGGGQQFGYTDPQGNRVSALQDMINGGGAGMAGNTFQGGLLSGLLNTMGVRPAGYRDRQPTMRPQMRPDNAPSVMAPSPASTPSTSFTPAATPSPTQFEPIDIAGPVRALPPPAQPQLSLANLPSATSRYMAQYGISNPGPSAMTTAPMQPGMNVMPDNGETFMRQNIAVVPALSNPMATTPQTDPRVSRSYRTMVPSTPQIQGFRPFPDTTPPRAVNPASLPAGSTYIPANQFTRNASSAYRDMQLRALAAQGLLPQ